MEPTGTVTVTLTVEDAARAAEVLRDAGEDEIADVLEKAQEDMRL